MNGNHPDKKTTLKMSTSLIEEHIKRSILEENHQLGMPDAEINRRPTTQLDAVRLECLVEMSTPEMLVKHPEDVVIIEDDDEDQ